MEKNGEVNVTKMGDEKILFDLLNFENFRVESTRWLTPGQAERRNVKLRRKRDPSRWVLGKRKD